MELPDEVVKTSEAAASRRGSSPGRGDNVAEGRECRDVVIQLSAAPRRWIRWASG